MSKSKMLLAAVCVMGFSGDLFAQVKLFHPRPNNKYAYTANIGAGGTAPKAGEILFVKLRYGKKPGSEGVIEASATVEVNKQKYWGVDFKPPGGWLSDGSYQVEVWSKDKLVKSVEIEIVGPKGFTSLRPEEHQPPQAVSKVVMMGDFVIGQEKLQKGNRITAGLGETIAVAGSLVLAEGINKPLNTIVSVSFRNNKDVIYAMANARTLKDTDSRVTYLCRIKAPTTPGEYTIWVKGALPKLKNIALGTIKVE